LVDLALSSVTNTAGDFLTLSGGVVHKRTAAQTLTDIGGQAALTNPVTGTGTTNYLPKFTGTSTIGNSILQDSGSIVTIAGNVGVNGSPGNSFPLEAYINSSTSYTTSSRANAFRVYNSNTSANIFAGIEFGGAGTSNDGLAGINAVVTSSGSAALTFYTRDSNTFLEKMRITSGGNVGIGTASPEAILHVNKANAGGEGGYIYIDNSASSTLNSAVGIRFGSSSGASYAGVYTGDISNIVTNATDGASALTFGTFNGSSSGERMRINSLGNVGIATNNPTARLHLKAPSNDQVLRFEQQNDVTSQYYFNIDSAVNGALSLVTNYLGGNVVGFCQNRNGNVLIGTTTGGASKLRIVGLPTSAAGLSSGDVYNLSGVLMIA
jgi:hypothetical protein